MAVMLRGDAVGQIIVNADEIDADLIVVGSRAHDRDRERVSLMGGPEAARALTHQGTSSA